MKKILLRGFVVLLMFCGISSCTQNDGNIGEWFGHWKLNTISVNGAVDDEYGGNIFFSFQSKTFCQTMMLPTMGQNTVLPIGTTGTHIS